MLVYSAQEKYNTVRKCLKPDFVVILILHLDKVVNVLEKFLFILAVQI